jgi:predicted phosphoadenosine phosphosulfate sulfurtransferase
MPPEATTWDKIDNFPIARDQRPSIPDTNGFLFPPLKYGRVGLLMGIRADESLTRRRAVSRRAKGEHNYFAHWNEGYRNLTKIYPIYDWRTSDVWLAPQMFGWDYNRAYDVMEMAGMSHAIQRCAPPFGEEPLQLLWMYSVCFPEVWDKMCKRVPGAATAARYSRTHLYSFVGGAIKHPDMTWPEFIVYTLNKHPEPYRSEITARVKGWLDLHYEKTTDPLAANAAHPLTGTSWRFLLNIASRGDYKDRRQPGAKVTKENWDAVVRRYNEEIAEMRARGEDK